MRLKIVDVNYTNKFDWIFKLLDEYGNSFYIMNSDFYNRNNSETPITKKELDYFDKGVWINAITKEISSKNVVTVIY